MKRKQIIALLLASVLLLLCPSGCSSADYQLSKSELDQMLADAKAEGYEEGRNEGYEDGRSDAEGEHDGDYDNGYSDGYDCGRSDTVEEYERLIEGARENGYEDGVAAGASFDVDSVWQEGYQYGYNRGISESGASGTSSSYEQGPNEPTSAIAMPQPEVQQESQSNAAPSAASYDYIINTNTGKFHYTWCKSVNKMAEKNKWYYTGTRDSVVAMGYVPCKNCNP